MSRKSCLDSSAMLQAGAAACSPFFSISFICLESYEETSKNDRASIRSCAVRPALHWDAPPAAYRPVPAIAAISSSRDCSCSITKSRPRLRRISRTCASGTCRRPGGAASTRRRSGSSARQATLADRLLVCRACRVEARGDSHRRRRRGGVSCPR